MVVHVYEIAQIRIARFGVATAEALHKREGVVVTPSKQLHTVMMSRSNDGKRHLIEKCPVKASHHGPSRHESRLDKLAEYGRPLTEDTCRPARRNQTGVVIGTDRLAGEHRRDEW